MDNKKNSSTAVILIVSFILSFICGAAGAYLISKNTTTTESIVKNITTSELVETSISTSVDKVYYRTFVVLAYSKGKQISTGTGFIYKIEGNKAYILTNNHVIEGADSAKVEFNDDDTRYEVSIVGGDNYSDIAVLTLNTTSIKHEVAAVEFGDSASLKLGDTVFTVGSPMGVEYKGTVTKGIVSGLNRQVEVGGSNYSGADYIMNVIQIDAAVNPGNSGGPLSDVSGNVVGIISLKIVQDEVEGMGFAIPIEEALTCANVLETGKSIERPFVGISMEALPSDYVAYRYGLVVPANVSEGIWVREISEGSPAERAGLKANDIIVKINTVNTNSIAKFRYELYKYKVGDTIMITYYRNGVLGSTNVILGKNS